MALIESFCSFHFRNILNMYHSFVKRSTCLQKALSVCNYSLCALQASQSRATDTLCQNHIFTAPEVLAQCCRQGKNELYMLDP